MICPSCGGSVTVSKKQTIVRDTVVDICQACGWFRKREIRWMQARPDLKTNRPGMHRNLRSGVRNVR